MEIRLEQETSLVKSPGDSVRMSCVISGYSMTSYDIHWIRQRPGQALEWIGFMNTGNNDPSYAGAFQGRFTLTENVPSSTQYMEITGLTAADTAVYYCAREHSDTESAAPVQKHPESHFSETVNTAVHC